MYPGCWYERRGARDEIYSISAVEKLYIVEAVASRINRKAQGHVRKKSPIEGKLNITAIIHRGCSKTDRQTRIGGVDITSSSILQKPGSGCENCGSGREIRKHQSAARIKIRGADNIGRKIRGAA